ncbi:MAG TPA: hypothetical protein DCG57_03760 [Candidatus Riflebacteria bacterium]|jgi:thiol-disulfide isomerase/thioredoxin|nr:hypothetical protein [Candidatus Riflebacteria bacterium]
MKKLYSVVLLLFIGALLLPGLAGAGNDSYLDTIYQASDEGVANLDDSQCTPGVDCPEDKKCVGEECAAPTCEGDECKKACEGENCASATCKPGTCPAGEECVDGKCVPTAQAKLKSMLDRIENALNRLISRLMNKLLGINIKIKVVEAKKIVPKPEPKPEPEKPATPPADPPTKPTEPEKPAEPAKPAEPEKPAEPVKPVEPAKPADPDPAPAAKYVEHTNFEAAKKLAKEKGHPIMMVFSGSDWCGWCKRFDAEVRTQPAFQNYAKDNMETFVADFPRQTQLPADQAQQNESLMKQYGVTGFPTVLIVDADGKVIKKTGYIEGGAENYVNHLKSIIE